MRTLELVMKSYSKTSISRFPITCMHNVTSHHLGFCESIPSHTYASSLHKHYEQVELPH